MTALADVLLECVAPRHRQPSYRAKMIHPLPADMPVVSREQAILGFVAGKRVVDLGASGPMHEAIVRAARAVIGIDRQARPGVLAFDLDDVSEPSLPVPVTFPEAIIAGEVLEHLSNPGWLLTRLRRFSVPLLVTVPHAGSEVGRGWLRRGQECVNRDHTAYYSPWTLRTLLERAGYQVTRWAWYNGRPGVAEGLIAWAE